MILCVSKDNKVVKYALNKTLSPLMVAEYKLHPALSRIFYAMISINVSYLPTIMNFLALLTIKAIDLYFIKKTCYKFHNMFFSFR